MRIIQVFDGGNQMTNRDRRLNLSGFAGILLAVLIIYIGFRHTLNPCPPKENSATLIR